MANEASNNVSSRRKFPRKSFRKSISFFYQGKGQVVEGVEIGEGGISFRSNFELPLQEKVIINFFIPEGDFFSIPTTLRSIQNQTPDKIYGFSFDEVSIALKRQIRAYVARTQVPVPIYST